MESLRNALGFDLKSVSGVESNVEHMLEFLDRDDLFNLRLESRFIEDEDAERTILDVCCRHLCASIRGLLNEECDELLVDDELVEAADDNEDEYVE